MPPFDLGDQGSSHENIYACRGKVVYDHPKILHQQEPYVLDCSLERKGEQQKMKTFFL